MCLSRPIPWSIVAALATIQCLILSTLHRLEGAVTDDRTDSLPVQIDGIFAPLAGAETPGVAVLVRRDGTTLFERGFGLRELSGVKDVSSAQATNGEHEVSGSKDSSQQAETSVMRVVAATRVSSLAIDARTNFRLASCTKQFTAMAVMLLVHDGKLRYDERLTEVFPEFPAYGKHITIRNLLNHTSGLRDYETLMEEEQQKGHAAWNEENQIQDAEVLPLLQKQNSTLFTPGTKWAYSNSGYVLLGSIVAKVSGKTFGEFLRERIFAPLKMDETLAYGKGKNEITNRAFGYTKEAGSWKRTDQSATSATLGDGGVYSSLRDLAKWDDALTDHTLLSEPEMRQALTPVQLSSCGQPVWSADSDQPQGTPVSYGFGWFLDPYHGHERMWHYGESIGFHTYIERFAADSKGHGALTIVVLCNRTDLNPEELAAKVADVVFAAH
jgi:CubicO group peptidase (beta-lactamase class C family)